MASLQSKSLNYAYVRFKATGLSGVRELDALLETTLCAHRMLCAQGFAFASALDAWHEISENLNCERLGNDVVRFVVGEVRASLLPAMNFCQRSRGFTAVAHSYQDRKELAEPKRILEQDDPDIARDKFGLLFGSKAASQAVCTSLESKGVFSQRHAAALVRVMGQAKLLKRPLSYKCAMTNG